MRDDCLSKQGGVAARRSLQVKLELFSLCEVKEINVQISYAFHRSGGMSRQLTPCTGLHARLRHSRMAPSATALGPHTLASISELLDKDRLNEIIVPFQHHEAYETSTGEDSMDTLLYYNKYLSHPRGPKA